MNNPPDDHYTIKGFSIVGIIENQKLTVLFQHVPHSVKHDGDISRYRFRNPIDVGIAMDITDINGIERSDV